MSQSTPADDWSDGISVRVFHAPLAYMSKSSPGFTAASIAVVS